MGGAMSTRGRPTVVIELSDTERDTLQRWVRRHSSAQALALRSRIVLACAEGMTNQAIAAAERVHPTTVSKWRHRFAADRLEGLCDAPRPGAARTIADETIEAVVVDTLESAPGDRHPLVDQGAGGQARDLQDHRGRDLAGLRVEALAARTASRYRRTPI